MKSHREAPSNTNIPFGDILRTRPKKLMFRLKTVAMARQALKERKIRFDNLLRLDNNARASVRNAVIRLETRLVANDVIGYVKKCWLSVVFAIPIFVSMSAVFVIALLAVAEQGVNHFNLTYPVAWWVASASIVGIYKILRWLLFAPARLLDEKRKRWRFHTGLLIYQMMILCLYAAVGARIYEFPLLNVDTLSKWNAIWYFSKVAACAALFWAVLSYIALLVVNASIELIKTLLHWRRRNRYALSVLIRAIVDTLWELQVSEDSWFEFDVRSKVMRGIEEIAVCIEKHVPRGLRPGDLTSDGWVLSRTKAWAAAIRSTKLWLISPKKDTRIFLQQYLVNVLTNVATGNWDALDSKTPEIVSMSDLWGRRIASAAKSILISLVPIAIVFIARRSGFTPKEPLAGYLWAVSILWIALMLLRSIDPSFPELLGKISEGSRSLVLIGKSKSE